MKNRFIPVLVGLLSTALFACQQSLSTPPVRLFAAAATRIVVDSLKAGLQQKGVEIQTNIGASGTLARQADQGMEFDLFISADTQWIAFLTQRQLIDTAQIHLLATNRLVIVAPSGSPLVAWPFDPGFEIASTLTDRIALGDPTYVPAGRYAQQVLDTLGWAPALHQRTLRAKDVASVLRYVELGECDWAMVYATEARLSAKVKILATVPEQLHKPIRFYLARSKTTSASADTALRFFLSPKGTEQLQRMGFGTNTR